jgi:3' exoribonuclease, RNase T-like
MRIFFDTEFIENGFDHPVMPISLGAVREDGAELYLEFGDVVWDQANDWVMRNVYPHLTHDPAVTVGRTEAAQRLRDFCGRSPQFWAYFAAFDWVIMSQLFGNFDDWPRPWPQRCNDLAQLAWSSGVELEELPPQTSTAHNALNDARWNRDVFDWLGQRELLKLGQLKERLT